jgi:PTH1 family peptidyl-tRNA hydrolase
MTTLLLGLGNPGDQYLLTRHNAGFIFIDALAHYHKFPSFKEKFKGLHSHGKIDDKPFILLKPQTYMNLSGEAVQSFMAFYKIKLDQIIVIHDDLDLPPFDMKVKKSGGNGGHNGLKSISNCVGNDYWRIRFGIGHPGVKEMVASYVLSNFSKDELEKLPSVLENFAKNTTFLSDLKPQNIKTLI